MHAFAHRTSYCRHRTLSALSSHVCCYGCVWLVCDSLPLPPAARERRLSRHSPSAIRATLTLAQSAWHEGGECSKLLMCVCDLLLGVVSAAAAVAATAEGEGREESSDTPTQQHRNACTAVLSCTLQSALACDAAAEVIFCCCLLLVSAAALCLSCRLRRIACCIIPPTTDPPVVFNLPRLHLNSLVHRAHLDANSAPLATPSPAVAALSSTSLRQLTALPSHEQSR